MDFTNVSQNYEAGTKVLASQLTETLNLVDILVS